MKDKLKTFIDGHRAQFDSREPSEGVWKRIEHRVFGVSMWNTVAVWRAAAVLLLGVSIYLYVSGRPTMPATLAKVSGTQEFNDIEKYYAAQISEKVALISDEGLFADDNFTQDIQKLEAMYNVIVEEMKKHPSEKVKDALVLNMLVRIDLLNQQIQRLEESKRKKEIISSI